MGSTNVFSPYAPVRYREELWWKFAKHLADIKAVTSNGSIATGVPEWIMQQVVEPNLRAMKMAMDVHGAEEIAAGGIVAKLMEHRHLVPLAAQYEVCGRQIFDLSEDLVEMLNHTDLGDCTLDTWNAPYDAFFVRFGKQESINLKFDETTDEYLDGALVGVGALENGERRIRFCFSMVKNDGRAVMVPGYYMDLRPEELRMPVLQGLDAALARRLEACKDDPSDDEFTRNLNEWRRDEIQQGIDVMRKGVILLTNALFYLELMKGKEPAIEPGRDVPPSMVEKWARATPAKRQKLRSELTRDGYTVVRIMGQEINLGERQSGPTGATKATHWRRGHWRNQHYGPNNSEVRRVLIKPVLINAHLNAGVAAKGHVYRVSSGSSDLTQ